MAIARQLVEAHGGTLSAPHCAGQGSVFTVRRRRLTFHNIA